MSVTPNGFAICCSVHEPGSVSDLVIFREMQWFHRRAQRKGEGEEANMEGNGPLGEEYPTHWAALADKGYQGATEFCRVIHLKRKPPGAFCRQARLPRTRLFQATAFLLKMFLVACAGYGQ